MRFKFRRALAVLVAVFAMSAVAAASASAALPELVNKEGKTLVKNQFSGTMIIEKGGLYAPVEIQMPKWKIYCEEERELTVTGKFTGLKTGEVTFPLKRCKGGELGGGCISKGAGEKEIVLPFSLTLVYTNKAKKEVALLYTLKENVVLVCSGTHYNMSGAILVPIPSTDVNKLITVKEHINLAAGPLEGQRDEQGTKQYENEKGERVETSIKVEVEKGSGPGTAGVAFDQETLFEEEVEFKA